MALDPDLLLLRDDGEDEFAGAKLEETEVRSVASNQSEMEYSSLQDMVRSCLLLYLVVGSLALPG